MVVVFNNDEINEMSFANINVSGYIVEPYIL